MSDTAPGRVYLDSNVFIYAVEGDPAIAGPLRLLFDRLRERPGLAVTSELTLAEVLVKAEPAERFQYSVLIGASGMLQLCPVSRDILVETSVYRRAFGMPKLADSIHVVTAMRCGCRTILSGDQRMKLPDGMSLIDADSQNILRLIEDLS